MIGKIFISLVVVFFSFEKASACNGYTLKMTSLKNCDPKSVVKVLPDFSVTMDKDCNLAFSGCVNVTKLINTAKGTYLVKKPPLPTLDGDIDYCDVISQGDEIPTIKQTLAAMGLPNKCPVAAKNYCSVANTKVNIGMFKSQLGLATGTTTVKLTADSDSGKICVEFSFVLAKPRKG